tara:strand:+ start:1873 stop:3531 length:1659 start_codon:yes stop_codon:yes gene_type:complete
MTLLKISGDGIEDSAITNAHLHSSASIAASKLADTGVSAGSYGSGSAIPAITVNAKGLITSVSTNSINTDLVADTSPQLGGDLASNGNDIDFADSDKAIFGTGSDLQIYHDGNNSFITDSGTGRLFVPSSHIQFRNAAHTETMAQFIEDGAVDLYFDGAQKFTTTSTGVTVTGNLAVTGTVDGRDVATDGTKLDGIESSATADQTASEILTLIKTVDGAGSGLDADTLDGVSSANFVRTNQNTTITSDLFIGGGAGGLTINDASDIRFPDGGWTGNTTTPKLNAHGNRLYIVGGTDGIMFRENATDRWKIDGDGHFDPQADNTYDVGQSNQRVRNLYAVTYYGDGSNLTGLVAFPSGTRMIFQQTSAPTGWTKDTSDTNQRALRVVSGSASSGGSVDFTTAFASKGVAGSIANATQGGSIANGGNNTNNATAGGSVNNHTLSTGRMPSHRHIGGAKGIHDAANGQYGTISNVGNLEFPLVRYTNGNANYDLYYTNYEGSSQAHNHGFSGSAHSHSINAHNHSFSGSAHNHSFSGTAINLAVRYLDVIIAQKD